MKLIFATIILLSLAIGSFAHEYWFEADNFFIKPKENTPIRLFVGSALKKDEERTYQAGKTDLFQMFSSDETFDLRSLAEDGRSPIMRFSADYPGTYLLSMQRNWSYIKLDAEKFEEYLKEDGIDFISDERKRLGESEKEGRERYSRYIKTLIQVGNNRTGNARARIGAKLEIVPLENPYSKKTGSTIKFQVFFSGRPLPNRTVFADNRDSETITTQKLVTDTSGNFTVKLDRAGIWLIRLVNMQRCEKNCTEADWESFWAALTFGVN